MYMQLYIQAEIPKFGREKPKKFKLKALFFERTNLV